MSSCRQATAELLSQAHSTDPQFAGTLYALLEFSGERIESLLILAEHGRLWDAEIITRSLQEATLKVVFLCMTDPEERRTRLKEYSHDLYEIDVLRRSMRMRKMLSYLDNDRLRASFEPLVLNAEEEKELAERWPGKRRKALQHRWSFTEVLKALDDSFEQRTGGPVMNIMLHNYTLSSHLIHADDTALGLIADRLSRNPEEQKAMAIAHRVRFLSDAFSLSVVACAAIGQALEIKSDTVQSVIHDLAPVFDRMHQLIDAAGQK